MFNPNYSLFNLTSNGVTYYPNSQSFVNPDHLNFFKFIGRMIGKALFDGHLLECYFSKPLYKMMVGQDITFEDQQDLDNDYFRSCRWGIENKIDDQELYFTVTTEYFGKIEEKELIPGG
jgi:E3 ubiquitin-protein ligase HUWE1